jgi:hypothetical protein
LLRRARKSGLPDLRFELPISGKLEIGARLAMTLRRRRLDEFSHTGERGQLTDA